MFELGPGPIMWTYINDFIVDKASSLAISVYWIIDLAVTSTTPIIKNWTGLTHFGVYILILGFITLSSVCLENKHMLDSKGKSI